MESKVIEEELEIKPTQSQTPSPALAAAAPPPKPGMWSKPGFRFAVFGGGIVLIGAMLFFYWYSSGRVNTDDAQVDGHLNPVSAKISGNVLEVLVNDNQQVKAGQVLVKIDPRDYRAHVDQMKAALALAQAQGTAANVTVPKTQQLTEGESSNASAGFQGAIADQASANQTYQMALTSDLEYARAQVAKQQATFDKAQSDLARMKPLADKEEISKQQFDGFVAAAQVAQGELDSSKQRLAQAQQNVTVTKAKLESKTAEVAKARAGQVQANANSKQVNIDAANAIAAAANIKAAEANLAAATDRTIVIPGHGNPVSNRTELSAYRDLLVAIQQVTRGQVYLSPGVSSAVIEAYQSKSEKSKSPLTMRERQVLQLIAEGKSTKDIASLLGISVKTAESHRTRLMRKLDIHEIASLVRYAIRQGVVQP